MFASLTWSVLERLLQTTLLVELLLAETLWRGVIFRPPRLPINSTCVSCARLYQSLDVECHFSAGHRRNAYKFVRGPPQFRRLNVGNPLFLFWDAQAAGFHCSQMGLGSGSESAIRQGALSRPDHRALEANLHFL